MDIYQRAGMTCGIRQVTGMAVKLSEERCDQHRRDAAAARPAPWRTPSPAPKR